MNKKLTFRRFVAFIIDIIIVSFIVGALSSLKVINPTLDKYNESYDKYYNYLKEVYYNNETSKILTDSDALDMAYDVSYYGRYSSIISVVVLFLYFGLFQYYTDGKTVGKLILRINVKATNGKFKLSNILIRSAIINSIAIKLLTVICLLIMKKGLYIKVSTVLEYINILLVIVSCAMIVFKQDGVGLHDLIAHTKVVRINEE